MPSIETDQHRFRNGKFSVWLNTSIFKLWSYNSVAFCIIRLPKALEEKHTYGCGSTPDYGRFCSTV